MISSLEKQKWATKVLGYGYEIIYKKENENVVADALSWKYKKEGSIFSISFIVVYWLNGVHKGWLIDPNITSLIQKLQMEPYAVHQGYTWNNEDLSYKGDIYLNNKLIFKSWVLYKHHSSPTTDHSRFHKTYIRIKPLFF